MGIASDAFDSSDPLKILSDCFRISFLTFVYDNVFFFDSFDFVQSRIYLSIYLSIYKHVSFFFQIVCSHYTARYGPLMQALMAQFSETLWPHLC